MNGGVVNIKTDNDNQFQFKDQQQYEEEMDVETHLQNEEDYDNFYDDEDNDGCTEFKFAYFGNYETNGISGMVKFRVR